jgi:acetoin utilization deacetylase AcuC-like enzyme
VLILAGPTGGSEHDGGSSHPERPARIDAVMAGVADLHLGHELLAVPAAPARPVELARVHTERYLSELEAFCAAGGGQIDPDTFAGPDSWTAAARAAGAGIAALDALEQQGDGVAFVAVRPPGHHARADQAMGFCLLNNIAVAAASLTARGARVLIVDWDVHHGNGTQAMFWNDPGVLYLSTHQWPLYPGTGEAMEVGGPGAPGLTVNIPVPPGATGDVLEIAFEQVGRPAIERFAPDWVLVSCGFDAHRADPLGQLELSSGDFARLARLTAEFAPRPGRLALFLEGGYDATALRTSVTATLDALLGGSRPMERPTSGGPGRDHVDAALAARRRAMDMAGGGEAPAGPQMSEP